MIGAVVCWWLLYSRFQLFGETVVTGHTSVWCVPMQDVPGWRWCQSDGVDPCYWDLPILPTKFPLLQPKHKLHSHAWSHEQCHAATMMQLKHTSKTKTAKKHSNHFSLMYVHDTHADSSVAEFISMPTPLPIQSYVYILEYVDVYVHTVCGACY